MKKGIALYGKNVLVFDGYVWEIGGREATFMGKYGALIGRPAMTPSAAWGKRVTLGQWDDHTRMLFGALVKQLCINPKMPTIFKFGMKVRLR